jgi:glycosyltransferase involved in cell wall biosynthesis
MAISARERLSIAIATYNGARFIDQQLQSFAEQTRLPDELVVTDDGSTDDTLAIIERFAGEVSFPVHVHRNRERLGYTRNFEAAIARCTGDIIFLSDQDDVWFRDKLESIAALFNSERGIQLVLNGQIITDSELTHESVTMLDNARRMGKAEDELVGGCATAFRRPWGELLLPMPADASTLIAEGALAHDMWLNELSVLLGVRYFYNRPLQYYRRHGDTATQSIDNRPQLVRLTDLIATRVKQPPIPAWERRAAVLQLYERWLAEHRPQLNAIGSVSEALGKLHREARSIGRRVELNRSSFPRRLVGAVSLWLAGGYRYFNGWKSAFRDLTRLS